MKNVICTIVGAVGSFITYLFGGWDSVMLALLIFMLLDLLSGLIVALVFHKSPKTETGTAESRTMFKGICRKFTVLIFVLIGHELDVLIGVNYIRNAVIFAFITNELLSIVENAGLMGIPIPKVIIKGIEILKQREDKETAQ